MCSRPRGGSLSGTADWSSGVEGLDLLDARAGEPPEMQSLSKICRVWSVHCILAQHYSLVEVSLLAHTVLITRGLIFNHTQHLHTSVGHEIGTVIKFKQWPIVHTSLSGTWTSNRPKSQKFIHSSITVSQYLYLLHCLAFLLKGTLPHSGSYINTHHTILGKPV